MTIVQEIDLQDIQTRYPDIIEGSFDPEMFVHEMEELEKERPGFHTILLQAMEEGTLDGGSYSYCAYKHIMGNASDASRMSDLIAKRLKDKWGWSRRVTPMEVLLYVPADRPEQKERRHSLLVELLTTLFPIQGKNTVESVTE